MADNSIQGVGAVDGEARGLDLYQMYRDREAAVAMTRPEAVQKTETKNTDTSGKPSGAKSEEKPADSLPIQQQSDVMLHFQVDEKTNDITIYLVDRATKRVIRSIPPNEVTKLRAGDLVKLLA